MNEVIPLVKNRLAFRPRQRVAEAIAKIQVGGVTAAFPVIPVSLPRDPRLLRRDRLDGDLRFMDEVIEPCTGDGVSFLIDDNRRFEVGSRRHAGARG